MLSPFKDTFVRFDIGMIEAMFGGFGGEIIQRPFNNNFLIGLSYHNVRQRGYKQRFSFRDYQTDTGHLSIYYDFPNGISSQFSVGKYLAGDKGSTIDLSRRFKSGFALGIFATFTDLSKEEFGEGSFDKGFYFSIPTELFFSDYRSGNISFGMHPLTKDGGAQLNQHNSLFGIIADTNKDALLQDWKELMK